MNLFKNAEESFEHSAPIRELLYQYDSFLDSLEVVADYGCGAGLDIEWWATLTTRDDPPEPRNYLCYAVEKDVKKINTNIDDYSNIKIIEADIEGPRPVSRQIDLLWCHNTFQYMLNPVNTLKIWNETMSPNGMLILSIPQSLYYKNNRLHNVGYDSCYFSFNIVNIMYMLAVNGFDCNDAFFYKDENDPWLYAAVYKSDISPMNPLTTRWWDLADKNLVNESVKRCLNKFGYVKQENIVTRWLDKDFHFPKE